MHELEPCGLKKRLGERIERMGNGRIVDRVYGGGGSAWELVQWITRENSGLTVYDCFKIKEAWVYGRQGEWCMT